MTVVARQGRTQKERRDETRATLLDATVASLLEVGFAKTTTSEVQRRAGLSRGALLHHFPAKSELLVATVGHLAMMRGRELKALEAELPAAPDKINERVGVAIDLLWGCFSGPLFRVAIELRNAARTDHEFRKVLAFEELKLRNGILEQSRRLFGSAISEQPGFEAAIDMTLQLMIGAALSQILHHEPNKARVLIGRWKSIFVTLASSPNEFKQGSLAEEPLPSDRQHEEETK